MVEDKKSEDVPDTLCEFCNSEFELDMKYILDEKCNCPICGHEIDIIKAQERFKQKHLLGEYEVKPPVISNGIYAPPKEMLHPFTIHSTKINGEDYPNEWVGWINGFPWKVSVKMVKDDKDNRKIPKYDQEPIALTGYQESLGPPLNQIQRFIEDGRTFIAYDDHIYEKQQFVKKMTSGVVERRLFTYAIENLPLSNNLFAKPMFTLENDHFVFPQGKIYPREEEGYVTKLVKELHIGTVDKGLYNEALKLLRNHPKQLTLFCSIAGAHIANLLGIENVPFRIFALGKSGSGKTFTIKLALKLIYGIGEAYLADDALDTHFRLPAITSTTNLPIYVDEAKISDKKKLKSLYSNVRGRPDQSSKVYEPKATVVLSANSDDFIDEDINEQEALNRRILKYYFAENDNITPEEESAGKRLEYELKNSDGGIIYDILKQKTKKELFEKYFSFDTSKDKPKHKRFVMAKFGAWILGIDLEPVIEDPPEPDIIEEFFSEVCYIGLKLIPPVGPLSPQEQQYEGHLIFLPGAEKDNFLKIDSDGINTFFRSRSARALVGNISPRKFVKNYLEPLGFTYNSGYIAKRAEGSRQIAKGHVPERYFKSTFPPIEGMVTKEESVSNDHFEP